MPKTCETIFKIGGITLAVYLGIKYVLPVGIPFLAAWIMARLVLPAARCIQKKTRIRKEISGVIILLLVAGGLCTALYFLGQSLMQQIYHLTANLDLYMDRAETFVRDCCQVVEENTGIHAQAVEDFFYDNMVVLEQRMQTYAVPGVLKNSISYVLSVVKWIGVFLVVAISVVLILKDYDEIKEKLETYGIYQRVRRITAAMQSLGGAWLRAQVLIIFIVTVVCVTGLWLLRHPYALLLGIVIGLLDALPFIGTGTILIPWGAWLMFTGQFSYGVCLIVLFLAANTLREYLEPKLIGDKIGVYPIVVVAAVYVGLRVFGVAGVLLGPVAGLLILEIYKEVK